MLDDTPRATVEKKRYGNIARVRLVDMQNQVREEWVFVSLINRCRSRAPDFLVRGNSPSQV